MNHYEKKCSLCPRNCNVIRSKGERGFCGASDKVYVALSLLHHWEEPCISGTNGSGAVFFSHCSLGCVYCQNRQISRRIDVGKNVDTNELSNIFLKLQKDGAHNINLVTAQHYIPSVIDSINKAKNNGLYIPIVYNSSGYESIKTIDMLNGIVDIYLPDFKYYSCYYSKKYSNATDYFDIACEAIDKMINQTGKPKFNEHGIMQKGTIIRHLMLPTLNSDTSQILNYIAKHWRDDVLVSLMRQYTPFDMESFEELNRCITDDEYEDGMNIFTDLGLQGFFQQKESVSESFIPEFIQQK